MSKLSDLDTCPKPEWWNEWDSEFVSATGPTNSNELIFVSRSSTLTIKARVPTLRFRLRFKTTHERSTTEHVLKDLTRTDLERIFGLRDGSVNSAANSTLLHRFSMTSCGQGLFFRTGKYLNIPHPNIGGRGDPNLSVRITLEIREAVREFLDRIAPLSAS